jgi:nicotinamide-nucleotide amidase
MKCVIIAIGTEVVSGDIVNTNARFIADYLKKFGVETVAHNAVLDNERDILRAVRKSFKHAKLVVTTGGLGPTYDDITKIAIAKALKTSLELDEDSLVQIRGFFNKMGREMTKNNERQAYFPKNSIIIENKNGTAPACIAEWDKGAVIMLPGPPCEMIPLMQSDEITGFLNENKDYDICEITLKFFGIGESALEEKLKRYMQHGDGLTLAPYAKTGEVELKITSKGKGGDAKSRAEWLKDKIYSIAGDYIYAEGHKTAPEVLIDRLREKRFKIITVESCTGGLIAEKITAVPGSSDVFAGGLITYSNELKMALAGVKKETLDEFGAVSKGAACEMAEGALTKYNADIAVSVTGIAGPGGGSEEKPVGRVYLGVATKGNTVAERYNFAGNREKIRELSYKNALHFALREIGRVW